MKRNIEVTIAFKYEGIAVSVMESFHNADPINIFSATESYSDQEGNEQFIAKCKKSIEEKLHGKITNVNVVIQHHEKFDTSFNVVKHNIQLANGVVSKRDVQNVIELLKLSNKLDNKRIVNIHPIQFGVRSELYKKYSEAPIGKVGKELTIVSSISYMSNAWYKTIASIITSNNLTISQLFLSPQINIANELDISDLDKPKFYIYVGSHNSFMAITKNGAIVELRELNKLAYSDLIQGISKIMNWNKQEAQTNLTVHGTLLKQNNHTINNQNPSTVDKLTNVIYLFFKAIYKQAKPFIESLNIEDLQIVIMGKVVNIKGLEESVTNSLNIPTTIFKPKDLEYTSTPNYYAVGVYRLFLIHDHIFDNNIQKNIIDTNPESIDKIYKRPKNTMWKLFTRFMRRQ